MAKKRSLMIILVLVGVYFLILPGFWPKPKIAISVTSADQSPNISEATVSVRTWHSNITFFKVKGIFPVDKGKNNGNASITRNLLPEIDKKIWDLDHTSGTSLWTWPRSYNFRLELPIEELRNKTDSNYVTGRIYVKLKYRYVWQGFKTTVATCVEKVKIVL